jgi:hypothetical protein
VQEEFDARFPNYEHNFSEFIQVNVLADENNKSKSPNADAKKKDEKLELFSQVFELVAQKSASDAKSDQHVQHVLAQKFYHSFSAGSSLLGVNSLLSHVFFTTSINLKFEAQVYEIYALCV